MNDKSVFIVILNYNHLEDLQETIYSFLKQDYPNLQIVVSDNGSSDGSINWLKAEQPGIVILENGENLGWAEGNNVGIRYALGKKADYVVLANNDIFFDNKRLIAELISYYKKFNKVIIGPKQIYYYNPTSTFTEGRIFMKNEIVDFNNLRVLFDKSQFPENFNIVDYVPGSFMLIPSELFHKIGLIDSDYFLYGEDTDFSFRAWQVGYASVVDRNLIIKHKVSATASGSLSKVKVYYQARNSWFLIKKHYALTNNILFFKKNLIIKSIKRLVKYVIKGRINLMHAFLIGTLHGITSNDKGKYF
ncbi:MAG: glycosyltransferase family 2 protein [Bacteroidales bacterium]|nr:glycosyltransferase family 2 protein [Bacteroidales bacterium]